MPREKEVEPGHQGKKEFKGNGKEEEGTWGSKPEIHAHSGASTWKMASESSAARLCTTGVGWNWTPR